MKNFQFVDEIIEFINNLSDQNSEVQLISINNLEKEYSRLKATHKIKDFGACIYNIPIERFMLVRSGDGHAIAVHLFVNPTPDLADLIEADLGDCNMKASWGIEETSAFDILSWQYGHFVVDLRKSVQNLDAHYTLLPPYDVITISNDVYKKLK